LTAVRDKSSPREILTSREIKFFEWIISPFYKSLLLFIYPQPALNNKNWFFAVTSTRLLFSHCCGHVRTCGVMEV